MQHTAMIVAKITGGVIVKVQEQDKDRYLDGSPFWTVVPAGGEIGTMVSFKKDDVLACSPTLEAALLVLRRS